MTKDVIVSISGLHFAAEEPAGDKEALEIITPASYYQKNQKHYIIYEELAEGTLGAGKTTMKITGGRKFEIIKSGAANTHMVFEEDCISVTDYKTPFGDMLVGVHTRSVKVRIEEEYMKVRINYSLDVNEEYLTDCEITVNVKSVGAAV